VLGNAEGRFPGRPEDLGNGLPLLGLNAVVEIFEFPAQQPAQSLPHTGLTGAHEAHQEYNPGLTRRRTGLADGTRCGPHTCRIA
jgi:hypothetical protein